MAKKSILGIDVGHDQLKLALVQDGVLSDAVSAPMPDNLVREGNFSSAEALGELISRTMKEHGIKARQAAYVLPNELVYIKNVNMPMMTTEQLRLNLPYEFNDYITGEIKDYVFDYAVLPNDPQPENAESEEAPEGIETGNREEQGLKLMAVGAERVVITEIQRMLSKCSLKLVKAAPTISTYIALIRNRKEELMKTTDEFGILDLGHRSVRMHIFKEDRHEATRILEVGLSSLTEVVSELYGVESHLAHTYILSNYENCLERDECRETFESIAVELMRAVNFYKFSNPDSNLTDMWLCGGGAFIKPLCDAIGEVLDMRLHTASELVDDGDDIPGCNSFVQAIGVTLD